MAPLVSLQAILNETRGAHGGTSLQSMAGDKSVRNRNIWRRLAVAIFVLAAAWLIAWAAARLLIVEAQIERADAIVVLSGSKTLTERVTLAAHLFKESRAPKIILTNDNLRGGWISAEQRNPYFYETAVRELVRLGVPESAIIVIQTPVSSTQEEALVTRAHLPPQSGSLLIVTSGYHSRRAIHSFRNAFEGTGTTIGIAPVMPGWQTPRPTVWWLHGRGWEMVPVEYVKLIYYAFRY